MLVKKSMYNEELQNQYNQYRFLIGMNKTRLGLKAMSRLVRLSKGQELKGADNETQHISSSDTNNHAIRTRIYRPDEISTEKLPAMLYLHGGGYMMGIPEMAHPFYSDIIRKRNIVIVAPDYRLSQTDPFPAGFNDCYDVLLWMRDNAEKLNIDPNNIVIAGHSAGGGMAAAITLKARDTKDIKPAFQMPMYPMIDHRMMTESSKMEGSTMWDSEINAKAWDLYLKNTKGDVPAYASPALNTNYNDFPPTISFVADLEPFHDENIAYIDALKNAGIPVMFKEFKGGYHGFEVGSPNTEIAKEANTFQINAYADFYDRYILGER